MKKDFGKRGGMKKGHNMKQGPRGHHGGPKAWQGGPKGAPGSMLAAELGLSAEQKEKAKAIMDAAKPKIEAIQSESRDKVKAVMQDAAQQLRPILTPEQQAVFDSMQKLRADKEALKTSQKKDEPKPAE